MCFWHEIFYLVRQMRCHCTWATFVREVVLVYFANNSERGGVVVDALCQHLLESRYCCWHTLPTSGREEVWLCFANSCWREGTSVLCQHLREWRYCCTLPTVVGDEVLVYFANSCEIRGIGVLCQHLWERRYCCWGTWTTYVWEEVLVYLANGCERGGTGVLGEHSWEI